MNETTGTVLVGGGGGRGTDDKEEEEKEKCSSCYDPTRRIPGQATWSYPLVHFAVFFLVVCV